MIVKTNRPQGCFDVWLEYDGYSVVVKLKPDVKQQFIAFDVRREDAKRLTIEEGSNFEIHARRELMAWFKSILKPQASHVVVNGIAERVEIAFLFAIKNLSKENQKQLTPLGQLDLIALQSIAKNISEGWRSNHVEARKHKERIPPGTFEDIKSRHVEEWKNNTHATRLRRDLFSSILGKAFAWKENKVPRTLYEDVEKIRPGVNTAFALQ